MEDTAFKCGKLGEFKSGRDATCLRPENGVYREAKRMIKTSSFFIVCTAFHGAGTKLILMNYSTLKRKITSLKQTFLGKARITFSQYGEDLLIMSALNIHKVSSPTYIDIGANDPVLGNNTYFFYQRGCRGVLIEPNPSLHSRLKQVRPGDISLNIGIGNKDEVLPFYLFDHENSHLNTFSTEEKEALLKNGLKVQSVIDIQLKNINDIISQHFQAPPTIMSLDVEGLDEAILHALNFERFGPGIICVETVSYSSVQADHFTKRRELIDFVLSKGYYVFADTFFNTILCSNGLSQAK